MPLFLCIFWHDRYSSISYLFYKGIFYFLSALPLGQDAKSSQLNYQDRFIISSRGTSAPLDLLECKSHVLLINFSTKADHSLALPLTQGDGLRTKRLHLQFIYGFANHKNRERSKKRDPEQKRAARKKTTRQPEESPTNSAPTRNQSSTYRYHQESPSLNKPPRMTKP